MLEIGNVLLLLSCKIFDKWRIAKTNTVNPQIARCQFLQYFTNVFFVQKSFWQLFSSYMQVEKKLNKALSYKKCACEMLMKLTKAEIICFTYCSVFITKLFYFLVKRSRTWLLWWIKWSLDTRASQSEPVFPAQQQPRPLSVHSSRSVPVWRQWNCLSLQSRPRVSRSRTLPEPGPEWPFQLWIRF
jgi:hypothetical protein